jgi:multiple sugar transport system ATP-binding protein
MASITVDHVSRVFPDGTEAVKDVDLEIEDGEFVILVGPSGCGKSTLLRMIVGLEDVTDGRICIDDEDVTNKAPRDRNLAMVFQNYALYPHMTVRGNLEFPLKLAKVDKGEIRERVDRAAEVLELTELLDKKPANLSGGQRQRVAMGRAIVREPAAFLLDEPLSNLDAKLRVQMRFELDQLQDRLGTTTVYVTHDQTEAMTLGDRVAVMRKGVVQQVASPKELYLAPANLFVAGFIGSPAMNFFPADLDGHRVKLPMCEYDLPEDVVQHADRLAGKNVIVGVRPEHFESVDAVGRRDRDEGARFTATVDVLEWLGSELFAHFSVERREATSSSLDDVADELEDAGVRQAHEELTVARIDPASEVQQGDDAEFVLDVTRLHYFDADSGENLLREADRENVEQMEERTEERAEERVTDREPPSETRRSA